MWCSNFFSVLIVVCSNRKLFYPAQDGFVFFISWQCIIFPPFSPFPTKERISQGKVRCEEARGYFFADSGIRWGKEGWTQGEVIAARYILS